VGGGVIVNVGKSGQWVSGSDELLAETQRGLLLLGASGGWRQPTNEFPGAQLPVVFSPRGDQFIYADSFQRMGRLWRVSLNGSGEPKLLTAKVDTGLIPCGWSANDEVLFWEDPDFSASFMADGLPLNRVNASGGPVRPLGIQTLVHDDVLSWSPTRDKIAVSTGGDRNHWAGKRIATVDLRTDDIEYLTDAGVSAVSPAWSPDGNTIVYSAAPGIVAGGGEQARRALAQRRIFAGSKQLLGSAPFRDEAPMWSAEGTHILFGRMASDSSKYLWLMAADGSDAHQVAGPLGGEDTWFGYYGYIDWRGMFDWK
jgi:Tol biopolymer transport system component